MPDSTPNQRSRQSLPHRRLQNLYIGLFLALGAALCGAEIARQSALREQAALVDIANDIRLQGIRASVLFTRSFELAARPKSEIPDDMETRMIAAFGGLRRNHDDLLADAPTRSLDPEITRSIDLLTVTLDEIDEAIATPGPMSIFARMVPGATRYLAGLDAAGADALEQARTDTRTVSLLSLTLFGVTAILLMTEALFLIIPATRRLQSQWKQSLQQQRDAARLSDRFRELIDSASTIRHIQPSSERDREHMVIAPTDRDEPSVFDLDELHAVEASLRLLEAAVVNSRDGILIVECGGDYRVVFCNDTVVRLVGLSRTEILGHAPWELHASDPESEERLRCATRSCGLATLELRLKRADGELVLTRVDLVPVHSESDGPSHIVLSYRDITERVLAERALQDSLDRFELIGRITLEGIYDLDLNTGRCWRNEQLIRNFGSPSDETGSFFDWLHTRLHPDDANDAIASFREFIASDRSSWQSEYRQLRTDGTWAYVRDRASLMRDPSGRPYRLVGSLEDLTALRQQQWAIEQNNDRLQQILDDQTELVCRYDLDFTLTFVNQAYADYFGRDQDELIGTPFTDLIPEEDHDVVLDSYRSLTPDVPTSISEHRVTLPDGSIRWQRWTDRVILDADRQVIAYQAVGRDVTEEVLAKHELEQAESRYRAFIRNSSEAIFRIEFDPPIETDLTPAQQAQLMIDRGVIAEVNDAFSQQYGRDSAADSVGLTLRDLFGDDPEVIAENLRTMEDLARQSYAVDELISREVRADGSAVVFSNSTLGIVEGDRLVRVWGTQRDITDQLRAEQELRQTNTMLELFIEHAPAAVAMFDRDMRYIAASRRWVHDYGLEGKPLLGRSHYEVFPEIGDEWRQIHAKCMNGESMIRDQDPFERADGSTQWIRWDVRPWYDDADQIGGIVMFTEEITERKLAADRLREVNAQQERLLTELDHRVKNALGGLLSLIEMGTHEQTDVQSYAASIARRVRSMASVHAMLSESRWKPLDLKEIVKAVTPADTPGAIVPQGPPVQVPAHQATPLAMILQEFVSNSLKYGALSTRGASARVTWEAEPTERDEETLLKIIWQERGGPPVEPEPKEGVGSQLIRGFARFELRGSVEFDFSRPEGVLHTLTCRLSEKH